MGSAIKLKVKARSVSNWKFMNNVSASEIPDNVVLKDEPEQTRLCEAAARHLFELGDTAPMIFLFKFEAICSYYINRRLVSDSVSTILKSL